MNCKPGDLAVLVHSDDYMRPGRLCEVLQPMPAPPFPLGGLVVTGVSAPTAAHWWVRWLGSPVTYFALDHARVSSLSAPVAEGPCLDAWLRPLRNGDELDETLRLHELPASPLGVEHVE